jgi:hypothetical protein
MKLLPLPSPLLYQPGDRLKGHNTKLDAAVQFLQERNQQVDHENMWAIIQSLIASLTGSNIALTAKPFWKQIEADMSQYNHDRALDDRRHNYGRKDQLPRLREEFDTWLEGRSNF